jgi:phenylalanyl-tRNA synthetase beta chain
MLRTLQWNLNRGIRDLQFYEFGKVYRKGAEERWLILAATGALRPKTVHEGERPFNFYDIKGDVEDILQAFDYDVLIDRSESPPYYHPGRFARSIDDVFWGELHPEYAELFKLRQRVYIAELKLSTILSSLERHEVRPIPKYPSIRRDLSLLVNKGVTYAEVLAAMPRPKELVKIEPFDRVESGPFSESKYSLAISLWYQSNERTLTDAEVEELHAGVLQALAAKGMEQRK